MSSLSEMLAELRGQAALPVAEPVQDDSSARIEALEKAVSEIHTALAQTRELLNILVRSPPPGSPRPASTPRTPLVLPFPSPEGVSGGFDVPRRAAPRFGEEDAFPLPGPPPAPFLSALSCVGCAYDRGSVPCAAAEPFRRAGGGLHPKTH